MIYSTILLIGGIIIYLLHSKCMGLDAPEMNLDMPIDSVPPSPCLHKSSMPTNYGEIQRSVDRLETITQYFTDNWTHEMKNDSSFKVWLELVDIQNSLKEMYTNSSEVNKFTGLNQKRVNEPLILGYARSFLPYNNQQGAIIQQVSNDTLSTLSKYNETESELMRALRESMIVLINNVDNLDKEAIDHRQSQYDHLQAVSGDIVRLYESVSSQNQTAEQMKSYQVKIMQHINKEINERETSSSRLGDLRADVSDLRRAFEHRIPELVKNISRIDERVVTLAEENREVFPAAGASDDEWESDPEWASMLEKLEASSRENITDSSRSDNQSVSLNPPRDLQVIQNKVDLVSDELEQAIRHVETRLAEFGAKVKSLEQRLSLPGGANQKITRKTCNGARRHLIHNSCYFVPILPRDESQYTWWDARYLCKENLGSDADLIAVETDGEMEAIIDLLTSHFGGLEEFWIGASDLDKEGIWVWSGTGKSLEQQSFTNWAEYPQVSRDTNCMSLLRGYKWVDEPCFYERTPICELRV